MKLLFNLFQKLFSSYIMDNYEDVIVYGPKGEQLVRAKLDTGANRTSIDKKIANDLGLVTKANIIGRMEFTSGLGKQTRDVIKAKYLMKSHMIEAEMSVSDRSHMAHKLIIGRLDIHPFLIKPSRKQEK